MMNGFMFNGVKLSIKQIIIYNIYIMGVDWSDNVTREMIANQFLQIDNTKIVEELQENVNRLETKVNKLNNAVLNSKVGNGIVASRIATSSPSSADAVSSPPFTTSSAADVETSPADVETSPLAKQRRYSPSFVTSPFMDSPVARSPVVRYSNVSSHPFETSSAVETSSDDVVASPANLINNSDKSLTSTSNNEQSNSVPPAWLNSDEQKKKLEKAVEVEAVAKAEEAKATMLRKQKNRDTLRTRKRTASRLRPTQGGYKNKNITRKNKHRNKK